MYEAEQKQRVLERQIRKWKRIESGSVDAKNVNNAAKKVKELEYQLTNHLDKNKQLRRAPQRELNRDTIEKNIGSDKIIDRKWLKANFSTQKKYDRHVEKHLSEYGGITPEDYVNIARDLLAAPLSNDIEGFISKDGFTFKYRISTNDFTIGRADGKISTLFKPDENIEYWKEQISLFKDKGE